MKPRWKRCAEQTDRYLGEALGKKYVEKYFPPEAKTRMQEMVRNLLLAMRDDILTRPWVSRRNQRTGAGQDRNVQSENRLSRQVEGLQQS
jgi:predicted metalloendopeptidase